MNTTDRIAIAKALVTESRAARLGLGHWADCSAEVRKGNARSSLVLAASYRLGR